MEFECGAKKNKVKLVLRLSRCRSRFVGPIHIRALWRTTRNPRTDFDFGQWVVANIKWMMETDGARS